MTGLFDDHTIDVACPKCGAKVAAKLGALRKSPTLTCPNGHEITVDASDLEREMGGVDRAYDDLRESLKKFSG